MSKFSERLIELRKASGLTQEMFAKRMGIARSTVGMYERGDREPDFDMLEAIADFFNVDIDYLLGKSNKTTMLPESGYYTNPETARLAQEMFEDPQMRSLFHMKRNMEPDKFSAHYDMMKKMYQLEHPEDSDDYFGA